MEKIEEEDIQKVVQEDINIVAYIAQLLESVSIENRNKGFIEIMELVYDYLHTHCVHSFVTDYIDTDVENSQPVIYCEKCQTTTQI